MYSIDRAPPLSPDVCASAYIVLPYIIALKIVPASRMASVGRVYRIWWLIASLLCLQKRLLSHGATIFPSAQLSIMEGAGFLAYIVPDQIGRSIKMIHCALELGSEKYSLDSDQVHVIGGVTKVQRFSAELCGIRAHNVTESSGTRWTLSSLDNASNEINQSLTISVLKPKQNSTINVAVSDTARTVYVNCPEDTSRRYCRILDQDDRVYDSCSQSFDITWEEARFRCRILYWGDMYETEVIVDVRVEKEKRDVKWSTVETDSHVVLTCQYTSALSPCRAVSVTSNRQMMLLDGHLADRYSAYNTVVSSGICSLEIQKPLLKEDFDVWRIYLQLSSSDYTGCVFDFKQSMSDDDHLLQKLEFEASSQAKPIEIFHDPQSSAASNTELTCEAPYPIDYCYLSGPQSGDFTPQRFQRLSTLGICLFSVQNITSGKWACGLNDNNGGEDRFTYYDVKVYDRPGRAITGEITASAGDKHKTLLCKTILDLPIEICRFVSPSGEVYGLSENIVPGSSSRFKYHGTGLRNGECGVEIIELMREDFGRWRCSIKVQGRDYAIDVDVIEEVMSKTTILAISISVTIVVCLAGGFFAYKKFNYRRIRYRSGMAASGISMNSN